MTSQQRFIDIWIEAGGLIRQADTARLFEVSRARVNQIVKESKIKSYTIGKQIYLPFPKVYEIYKAREKALNPAP